METTNDNLIDKQLYISMQQGNKKAFDTLFIKYYAMLCAFARSFVSLEDAEEVVQDTMLQIWENRKTNHWCNQIHEKSTATDISQRIQSSNLMKMNLF